MGSQEMKEMLWKRPIFFIIIPVSIFYGWAIHSDYANTTYSYTISAIMGAAVLFTCWSKFEVKLYPILICICMPLATSKINDMRLKTIEADCKIIGLYKRKYNSRSSGNGGRDKLQLRCDDNLKEVGVYDQIEETKQIDMRIQLKSGLLGFERI